MKPFYADFTQHCMRFFIRNQSPAFKSSVDMENWHACKTAWGEMTGQEREILQAVYTERDLITDNVFKVAKDRALDQDVVWRIVRKNDRKVAKARGLI